MNISKEDFIKVRDGVFNSLVNVNALPNNDGAKEILELALMGSMNVQSLATITQNKAVEYLYVDETYEEIAQMINAIEAQAKIDGSKMIDHVDGVQTLEQFEYVFTCNDFLKQIA